MSATVTTIGRHVLHLGDCVEILRAMPGGSVDACVTDPPYGLGFMGKAWDCDVPGADFAAELFRVLKPGAHACLFGGTRTFHRLTAALEDAGFDVRDVLSWLYGTGFPKSLDVAKHDGCAAWEGWGTALKPAWEPVILVRKPLIGTVAENVLAHGTGGLNIDATRIEGAKPATTRGAGGGNGRYDPIGAQGRVEDDGRGRWPANVVLDEAAAELLDAQAGDAGGGFGRRGSSARRRDCYSASDKTASKAFSRRNLTGEVVGYGDSGGASRFFYVAKPGREERGDGNTHPTVKPVELMRWLVRLVTPQGGVVIDPFMGSGTTGIAVHAEHAAFVGVEREPEYFEIARRRVDDACRQGQFLALFGGDA